MIERLTEAIIAYGPGILDLAHQPDEYVVVEDMLDAAVVMGLALGVRWGLKADNRRDGPALRRSKST